MNRVYGWLKRNSPPIGYAAGISCFVNGILYVIYDNNIMGVLQFMLGAVILLDVWETKE